MACRVFVISDTHFGHRKIIDPALEGRVRIFDSIEDHDNELIERWNAKVNKRDTVWHLGDVLFGQHSFGILGRLDGVKKLVLGNHDRYPIARYAEHFSKIVGSASLHGCIMTHIPIHPDNLARFGANVHGHLHSRKLSDPRYVNVCCEHTNLAPVLLSDALGLAGLQ